MMKNPPSIYKAEVAAPVAIEVKYSYAREVRIATAKNGQRRATYWSKGTCRWLPIPVDVAEYLVATGHAEVA
jgi:hypothetical protein